MLTNQPQLFQTWYSTQQDQSFNAWPFDSLDDSSDPFNYSTLSDFVKLEDSPLLSPIASPTLFNPFFPYQSDTQTVNSIAPSAISPVTTPPSPVVSHTSPTCPNDQLSQPKSPKSEVSDADSNLTPSERKKMREWSRNLTCFNCKTTKTPLWRRTHDRQHSLCNACGLYYKQYNTHRPVAYKDRHPRVSKKTDTDSNPGLSKQRTFQYIQSQVIGAMGQKPKPIVEANTAPVNPMLKSFLEKVKQSSIDFPNGTVTMNWAQLQALLDATKSS
ncbi:hypothetical protein BC833DRAFT_589168 [Globomyces pollinis-pini]|nr:hypothetical protein BC833DRAFT_589168 [Globomyces pollinis-pini]KAJ2998070.1 hypothetical protein HDV02_004895 [Globomyces sp. JEL0801]